MARAWAILAIGLSLCFAAAAQVNATLSFSAGRNHFKSGEEILLDLTFTASHSGYTLNTTVTEPASPIDTLVVAPMAGVFPWLDDKARGHHYTPDYAAEAELQAGMPLTVKLPLNAVYRFDQPGQYSVHVITNRVEGGPALTTNTLSFDIEVMTKAEEAQRAATLEKKIRDSHDLRNAQNLAQDLDWLAGEPSTRVKLSLLLHPKRFYPFAVSVTRGLWIARDRALVVRELERAMDDPAQPVSDLFWPAIELKARLEVPYDPAKSDAPLPEERIKSEYVDRIAASLSKRKGEALMDAARTALVELVRMKKTGTPEFAAAREILVTRFAEVNEYDVDWLLNAFGMYLTDARMVPALKQILAQPSDPVFNGERTAVLGQLLKIAPEQARPDVIREVCAVNPTFLGVADKVPFDSLPETDACLLRQLRSAQPQVWAAGLTAHFATKAIYDDVLRIYENGHTTPDTQGYLLAYLMRWDARRALPLLDRALPADQADPDGSILYALSRAYSPALESFLLERMQRGAPQLAGWAARQLSEHAPNDRAAIAARLQRWRAEWAGRKIPDAETNFEAELARAVNASAR